MTTDSWIKKYYGSLLLGILFFSFVTRIYNLHIPERYIFDEVYHAVTAKLIAQNDPRAFEWWNPPPEKDTAVDWLHPPLAKYTQALAMNFFGENSFGWRISSAFFGVLVIFLIAKLSLSLTKDYTISILATLFAALEGLLLVMSRIAMNDIHVTFAILLTLLLYLKTKPFSVKKDLSHPIGWYVLTGLSAGVAIASKWSGIFVLGIIFFYELLQIAEQLYHTIETKKRKIQKKYFVEALAQLGLVMVALIVVPSIVYIASYTQMFLQGKDFTHFIELHKQIWWYQSGLTATHTYQSTPLEWVINKRPVWMHVTYTETGERGDIYAHGNSIVLLAGLLAVLFYSFSLLKKLLNSPDSKQPFAAVLATFRTPIAFTVLSYFTMWIIWIRSPRIMFFYHYTPAIPFLVIILSIFLQKVFDLPEKYQPLAQATVITTIILSLIYFIVFLPHWLGIPLPIKFVDSVFFFFESWK